MSRAPVKYIKRTRDYYRAQGFEKDYIWAHHEEIPFTRLTKPLASCTVTVVTTAVADPDKVPKSLREAESIPFEQVPADFYTDDLAWDKDTTHTRDRGSYFPLEPLRNLESEGYIGKLAPRFHFVPTEYSQRMTTTRDAPAILAACREDEVDVAVLVPL